MARNTFQMRRLFKGLTDSIESGAPLFEVKEWEEACQAEICDLHSAHAKYRWGKRVDEAMKGWADGLLAAAGTPDLHNRVTDEEIVAAQKILEAA